MSGVSDHFYTPIAVDRDVFLRQLITSLGHLNEGMLGSDVTGAYIMNVGLSMGAAIEAEYKRFWGIERPFTVDEYAHVIVDAKQKIRGNFSLVDKSPAKVVVQTTSCPFDAAVRQAPSLCFMTSSVFGGIAARNFGYAKVVLHRRIALGDPGCYVSIFLQRMPEAEASVGKEYFPEVERASPDIAQQLRLMASMRQLHQQLGEMDTHWEEVVHSAGEPLGIEGPDESIVYANARWRDVLGVEGGELVGGNYRQIVHPDDYALIEHIRKRAYGGQRTMRVELRLRHRDGTWRTVLVSSSPLHGESSEIIGRLDIVHDVTAERESQRLKNDFIQAASHELRTPITSIKGMTAFLLRTLNKQEVISPEQLTKRLETIQRSADRLALLSNDLLDISRLQAGKVLIDLKSCDLRELVDVCVSQQRDLLEDTDPHAFVIQADPVAVLVNVERQRIEQVITNLLENALKYSPEGGNIVVTISREGDWARVAITDQGIGIPEIDLPNLFTPFYRASNVSVQHFNGLGLGLYLSRTFLEAQGGNLEVRSVVGGGSTFTLSLPVYDETARASASAEKEHMFNAG
jgi:PAS domain S-box-containing protein